MAKENQRLIKVLSNHHQGEHPLYFRHKGPGIRHICCRAILVSSQVEGQGVACIHGVLLIWPVVAPGLPQESLQGAVGDPLEALTVLVVVTEQRLEHGSGFSQDCDIYCVVRHQTLHFCLVEAHVAGDDVWRQRVRMNKVRGEGAWVAELVATGLHGQCHSQVVALCEAEQQVLHGGAGRFVGLEKGHIGVLGFQARGRVGTEGRTAEVEGLHGPAQVAPMVQQKTDSADGNDDQEYLLLRHRSRLHWDFVISKL